MCLAQVADLQRFCINNQSSHADGLIGAIRSAIAMGATLARHNESSCCGLLWEAEMAYAASLAVGAAAGPDSATCDKFQAFAAHHRTPPRSCATTCAGAPAGAALCSTALERGFSPAGREAHLARQHHEHLPHDPHRQDGRPLRQAGAQPPRASRHRIGEHPNRRRVLSPRHERQPMTNPRQRRLLSRPFAQVSQCVGRQSLGSKDCTFFDLTL